MLDEIQKRKDFLRNLIPKTKSGAPRTDRLEKLDSLLYSRKFSMGDLDYVEVEIKSAIEFFETRKRVKEVSEENLPLAPFNRSLLSQNKSSERTDDL